MSEQAEIKAILMVRVFGKNGWKTIEHIKASSFIDYDADDETIHAAIFEAIDRCRNAITEK